MTKVNDTETWITISENKLRSQIEAEVRAQIEEESRIETVRKKNLSRIS